jgi:hypothetical protein
MTANSKRRLLLLDSTSCSFIPTSNQSQQSTSTGTLLSSGVDNDVITLKEEVQLEEMDTPGEPSPKRMRVLGPADAAESTLSYSEIFTASSTRQVTTQEEEVI